MTTASLRVLALLAGLAAVPSEATATPSVPAAPGPAAPAASAGLDPGLPDAIAAAAARLPRLKAVLVLRDGKEVVASRLNGGPPLDRPVNIKSASKAVMSALAGIAIDRGILAGVDQSVAAVLASDLPANPDPRLARVTLGDLLSMRAGLERTSGAYYGAWIASRNWVRYVLSRPFVDEPGGRMLYSTGSSHLVSAMLTRASGQSTLSLVRDWLGKPLGIDIPPWPRDPQGVYFGGNDMVLSPRALARFGELYRNGGRVGDRQVISERWIAESWHERVRSPWSGNDYGYGWFTRQSRGRPVHFAWGYGGQMLFVVPALKLTAVMISDPSPHPRAESHVPALHALLDDAIVPAAVAADLLVGGQEAPEVQMR